MSARLRTSRSSAARAAAVVVLEDAKELLGAVDDRVRVLRLEPRGVVDPAPRHCYGEHPGSLRRPDVERRVADVGRVGWIGSQALRGEEKRFRVGLLLLGFVATDDRLEEVGNRNARERELHGRATLRRDDAESAALLSQPHDAVL